MPIYEYRCDNCAHEFETIQKVSDEPLKTCPACSEDALRKKISAAGFRLKGGGWYETDFKGNKRKNVAGEEKGGKDGDKKAGNGESGGDGNASGGSKSEGSAKSESSKSGDGSSSNTSKSKASE
jgi:putative FmdB family regulatory protein